MGNVTVWTRQVPEMLDELEKTGVYRVREDYIRKKNDTIADYYLQLYRWYTTESRRYLDIPQEAEFPIWFSVSDEFMLRQCPGTVVLKMEIPREKLLIIDIKRWEYRGNGMYVPVDDADRDRFHQELERYGIHDETALAESEKGNFYPLLRREILQSWGRLFTMPPEESRTGYATAWELKREWIREVYRYE